MFQTVAVGSSGQVTGERESANLGNPHKGVDVTWQVHWNCYVLSPALWRLDCPSPLSLALTCINDAKTLLWHWWTCSWAVMLSLCLKGLKTFCLHGYQELNIFHFCHLRACEYKTNKVFFLDNWSNSYSVFLEFPWLFHLLLCTVRELLLDKTQ